MKRFWDKVAIGERHACWPWTAQRLPNGYGRFSKDGKNQLAHRVAWMLVFGEIPPGKCVYHKCGNLEYCTNPHHLILGSRADVIAARVAKGKHTRGSRIGVSKLTESDVCHIRELLDQGCITKVAIGRAFGVSDRSISHIAAGRTWAWLPNDTVPTIPGSIQIDVLG